MTAVGAQPNSVRSGWKGMSLRLRVLLILFAVVTVVFIAGAAFLYEEAVEDRHALAHEALADAVATSGSFDREVAATGYLLQGLSRSPMLKSGDLRGFYDQLTETPRPEGSWFVLWDMNGQVLNIIRPFGTRLPTRAEIGGTGDGYERVRTRGLSISNLTLGPVTKEPAVAVHLRLDGPDGAMSGILSAVLPGARMNAVVRENPLPDGWTTTLLDRNLVPVATSSPASGSGPSLPPALGERLRDLDARGHLTIDGDDDLLVGIQRSAATGYTTITTVPFTVANAPVDAAVRKIVAIGALLLLAGAAGGFVAVRQVGPVEASAARTARELRLAQARYASLWNDTGESLFVVTVTPDDRFVFEGLNPAHERATGLTFDAIAGKTPEECLPPTAAAAVTERYRACLAGGQPMIYDEVLDLPGGRRFWQTSLAPVRDPETGSIIALVGTARDVTTDRQARRRVEGSQRRLQATLDALSAHIAILDSTGTIIAVNRAWHRFAEGGGYATPDHGVGANYLGACRAARVDPEANRVARSLASLLAGRREEFRSSYSCGDRFFHMTAARFTFQETAHVVVAHEDVTDLMAARQDVRDIAGRLLSLQEEERQRIAADLHDSTAQHIVAAGLALMHVQNAAGDLPGVREAVDGMRSSLDEAQREIRTLSYLLYPPNLRDNGLAASLRHFVSGFSNRTGLAGNVRISGDVDDAPLDLQRAVLRVVQEALVNVHRHAEATRVSVSVRHNAKGLHLRVTDNGKGLPALTSDPSAPGAPLGVGIPGMEARIRQFNGTMTIAGSARGTTIRATIPTLAAGGRRRPLGPEEERIQI